MTFASLVPRWTIGDCDLTAFPYSVDRDDGVEIGEPETVVEDLQSALADGSLARVVSHGNRTYVIPVYVEGSDLADLATSEAALRRAVTTRGVLLTHEPGDEFSPPSVYEVLVAVMTPERGDTLESHLMRKYVLTLTCAPFARSITPVTISPPDPPPSPTPVTQVIHDGNTTTGWSASGTGYSYPAGPATTPVTVSTIASFVRATFSGGFPYLSMTLAPIPVPLTAAPYIMVEAVVYAPSSAPWFEINGSLVTPIMVRTTTSGRVQYVLHHSGPNVPTITIGTHHVPSTSALYSTLTIDVYDVTATDTLPGESTRQVTRVIETGGTERTPASIHVTSPNGTDNLGITVVHTAPEDGSGYSPPLRRWRASGGTLGTAGPFSGVSEVISPSFRALVPTSALPEGGYQLVAILRCPTTTTVPVTFDLWTMLPDGVTRMGNQTGKVSVNFTANVWAMVVLAEAITLPTIRTKAGFVEVFIGAGSSVELDEAWLFRVDDDCALTYCITPSPNLWLDSPDLTSSVPTVWMGDDRVTSTHPGSNLAGMGSHVLHPDGTSVFVATSAVEHPEVSAEFYRRWHSNAAE